MSERTRLKLSRCGQEEEEIMIEAGARRIVEKGVYSVCNS